jgi:HSP20 family molecular chaperone IbpA
MLTKYNDLMTSNNPWRVVDDVFKTWTLRQMPESRQSYRCEQINDEMILSVDLPGVKPSDIDVTSEDELIIISYTLRDKKQTQSYDINRDYDVSAATAKLENGVIELRFPKIKRIKGKKIQIEIK